jgi:uncharacterized metal-binding protein YceD (DUF177 family)
MAIKINVGVLKDGSQTVDFISDAKEIGIDESLIKDRIYISADVFKTSNQIDLDVVLSGIFKLTCDRCLEIFEVPFENKFELVYVQKSGIESAGGRQTDTDYIRPYNPFMKSIDITKDVRDFTLLAVPMKKLPAENSDGSCSWCGKSKDYWKDLIVDEDKLNT